LNDQASLLAIATLLIVLPGSLRTLYALSVLRVRYDQRFVEALLRSEFFQYNYLQQLFQIPTPAAKDRVV
jgi:hypothetical protein